jgi:hypothetical protein
MMRFRQVTLVLVATGIIAAASSAFALDGNRKGFILGFSLGGSFTSYTIKDDYDNWESDRENEIGLATDFRIGGGLTEQFTLYYENRVSWFPLGGTLPNTDSFTGAFAVGLVGASYYFKTDAPSGYLLGSIGTSVLMTPFQDDSDLETATAFGLSGGVGYEFKRHWAVEGTLNWGQPKDDEVTFNGFAVMVTIGGTLY